MTIAERLKKIGHHMGYNKGLDKGEAPQEEALRIARMMLENGIDRDLVRLKTGLLPDDVTE
jgi:predicted transposase YdaD